jgi:quinol monooxygenase YgiN
MSLFFLEAYVHVHPDKVPEYESLSKTLNQNIGKTEPGMLIHVQTKVSGNEREVVYKWFEVYRSYDDLPAHLQNRHAREHMQKLGEGIVTSPMEILVFCDWTEEQKEPWRELPGLTVQYAPLVNGYFR